jgi:3',5'-cyclic AMP phosphodiesterase CpdA/uncharacterized protein YjbI with pentapeptide repeats
MILWTWLHLSDIHFRHDSNAYQSDQHTLISKLVSDVKHAEENGIPKPRAILLTGDVAFSGGMLRGAAEYDDAAKLISDLRNSVADGEVRVFAVPGNHDVQRTPAVSAKGRSNRAARLIRALRARESGESLDDAVKNKEDSTLLRKRFGNFERFSREIGSPVAEDADGLWLKTLEIGGGLRVRLIGLNTALLCNDDLDHGKLALPRAAINTAFHEIHDHDLVFVLTHHPTDWLCDGENLRRQIRSNKGVHFHGHIHAQESQQTTYGAGQFALTIAAGAVHADESENKAGVPNTFSYGAIVKLDDGSIAVRIWPRRWSAPQVGWVPDTDQLPTGASYQEHKFPQMLKATPSLSSPVLATPQQERHTAEQSSQTLRDLHARFTTATGQLAGTAAMSRQAGVHAIAALADDWHAVDQNSGQIQVCVDVLCSYLRRPWDPEDAATAEEQLVRETIHTVLRQHLQPNAIPSWSHCALNLAGAHLHNLDLARATIHRGNFLRANFTGRTSFTEAKFSATEGSLINFAEATFTATKGSAIDFTEATFTATGKDSWILFGGATFTTPEGGFIFFTKAEFAATEGSTMDFEKATFTTTKGWAIDFTDAKFTATEGSSILFTKAEFTVTGESSDIQFTRATFTATGKDSAIGFPKATFTATGKDSKIVFPDATFSATEGGAVGFPDATFTATEGGAVGFPQATFTTIGEDSLIGCSGTTFTATGRGTEIYFNESKFSAESVGSNDFLKEVTFRAAQGGRIDFVSAMFTATGEGSGIGCSEVTFTADAQGSIDFDGATFTADAQGSIDFRKSNFTVTGEGSDIDFRMAMFTAAEGSQIGFTEAAFAASGEDSWIRFGGATFDGTGEVSFADPREWVNVYFLWDDDPTIKPTVIRPIEWPPIPLPAP